MVKVGPLFDACHKKITMLMQQSQMESIVIWLSSCKDKRRWLCIPRLMTFRQVSLVCAPCTVLHAIEVEEMHHSWPVHVLLSMRV